MALVIECNTSQNPMWITIPSATTSSEGLMSAADKAKLDGIPAGGGSVDGLKGAYEAASSSAQNIIGLTAALGGVFVRDNAAPLATELFAVQDSTGGTDYFFVQGTGAGQGFGASEAFDFQTTVTRYVTANNTSAATVGVPVQYSPFYSALGTAWDTDDLVSRTIRFFWGVQPTSAATISGSLVWYSKIASAADTELMSLSSNGSLTLAVSTADYICQSGNGLLDATGTQSSAVTVSESVGTTMFFGANSFTRMDSEKLLVQSGAANAATRNALVIQTQQQWSTAGARIIDVPLTGGAAYGIYSGNLNAMGVGGVTLTVGANGSTINKLVEWAGALAVELPPATANLKTIAGVAMATKTNGQTVTLITNGPALIDVTGAVAAGDLMISDDGTAGNVKTNNAAAAGAIVGKAMEADGGTVAGKVFVYLDCG